MTEVTRSINVANANAFIPMIWSSIVIDEYVNASVVADRFDRRFESSLKKGDTVTSGSISKVVPLARSANTDLTYNTVVESSVNVVVNQDYYVFRMVEAPVGVQSIVDLIAEYAKMDAKALAANVDTYVAKLFTSFNGNTRKGTIGTDVEDDNLIDCVVALNYNNVPMEDRSWIISSETWGSLMKIDKFVRLDYVSPEGETAAMRAKLNYPIYGAPVFVSNQLQANAGNHNCCLAQKEAIRVIVQQEPKVIKAWDTRRGADTLLTEALYGAVEARDKSGICLNGK